MKKNDDFCPCGCEPLQSGIEYACGRRRKAPGTIDGLIKYIIHGNIWKIPLAVLGDDCPSEEQYGDFDIEQETRLAAAAAVARWFAGRNSER